MERYHREGGKGFSEGFQKVLDQITKVFKAVYKSLTGKELTPELRKMFDDILGKEAEPTLQTGKGEGDWSRDVESTAKALEKGNGNAEYSKEGALNVAKNYHKAKKDGTNPELVKAVEELLGKPKAETPNVGDWSKDVESTAKALGGVQKANADKFVNDFANIDIPFRQKNILHGMKRLFLIKIK